MRALDECEKCFTFPTSSPPVNRGKPMPTLNQYAAVLAYATESTEGVTWDQITDATAHHFREDEDPTFPIFALSVLGILAPVGYYFVPGCRITQELVLPTSDALTRLRKLNTASHMLGHWRDLWRDDPDMMNAKLIIETGLRLQEARFQLEVLGVLSALEES